MAKVLELFTPSGARGEDYPRPRREVHSHTSIRLSGDPARTDFRFLTGVELLSILQTERGNLIQVHLPLQVTAWEVIALERQVRFLLGGAMATDEAFGLRAWVEEGNVVTVATTPFTRMVVGDGPYSRAFCHSGVPTNTLRLFAPSGRYSSRPLPVHSRSR